MSPRYNRPPITEAIIDLRVSLPEDFPLDGLAAIHDHIKDLYPVIEPMHMSSAAIEMQSAVPPSVNTTFTPIGYRFRSLDGLYVFQARRDGFTLNRLAPYEGWDSFRAEARARWKNYVGACSPQSITRTAVRYINRLDLPGEADESSVNLNRYLLTVPELGQGMHQLMSNFFMQIECPQPDIDSTLVLNEAFLKQGADNMSSILLDFDLYQDRPRPTDDGSVWETLEVLRNRKNQVFEASITDAARELFN